MNEQKAEALVAKLMRIWELDSVDGWGFFDDHFYLRTQYDSNTLLDINPLIELNSCDLSERVQSPTPYQRILNVSPPYLMALEKGEIYEGSVEGYDTNEAENAKRRAEFSQKWRPLLRRNCWLMGYNIEASSDEKTQWSQSFEAVAEVAPSQVVSDRLRWERRRVAAAFGVEEWKEQNKDWNGFSLSGGHNGHDLSCTIDEQLDISELMVQSIDYRNYAVDQAPSCRVVYDRCDGWYFIPCAEHPQYNQIMSHVLYRLGFEREASSPKLKAPPLTAHEKVELRRSLPREFRPKNWPNEESE